MTSILYANVVRFLRVFERGFKVGFRVVLFVAYGSVFIVVGFKRHMVVSHMKRLKLVNMSRRFYGFSCGDFI